MAGHIAKKIGLFVCVWAFIIAGALSPVYAQLDSFQDVNDATLDSVNPLLQFSDKGEELSTPGGVLSRFLNSFAFPIAGLILFVMITWGGFEILSGSASKKSAETGRQRITAAIVGFLLLFTSYWIVQIIEYIFGVKIF